MEDSDRLLSEQVEHSAPDVEVASATEAATDAGDIGSGEAAVSSEDTGNADGAAGAPGDGTSNPWGQAHGGFTSAAYTQQAPPSHYNYSGKIVATEAFQMPPNSRCFIIKPGSFAEVEQIYNSKAIYPPAATRERLRSAAKEGDVYVAVSVNNSRALQGYGIIPKLDADDMGIVEGNLIKRKLDFNWQRLISMPFGSVSHVHNRLNGNQPVRMSRDGHELDRFAADQLISTIRAAPEASFDELRERLAGVGDLNPTLEYSDTSETCEKPPEAEAVAPEAPVAAGDAVSSSAAPERGGHARHDFKRHRDGDEGGYGHRRRHPAAFDLDLCDMTYEEYLEQYKIRKSLALDKFHASLAAAASTQMLPPPQAMVPGPGFFPGGPPQAMGMGMMYGAMGMPPRPPMMYMGGGGRGGGRGYYGGGGR